MEDLCQPWDEEQRVDLDLLGIALANIEQACNHVSSMPTSFPQAAYFAKAQDEDSCGSSCSAIPLGVHGSSARVMSQGCHDSSAFPLALNGHSLCYVLSATFPYPREIGTNLLADVL